MVARTLPLASTIGRALTLVIEDTFRADETCPSPSGTANVIVRSADEQAATPPYSLEGGATTTSASVVLHESSRVAFNVNRVSRSTMNRCDPEDALGPMSDTAGSALIVTSPVATHVTVTASPAHAVRGIALNASMEAQPTQRTIAGAMARRATNSCGHIRLPILSARLRSVGSVAYVLALTTRYPSSAAEEKVGATSARSWRRFLRDCGRNSTPPSGAVRPPLNCAPVCTYTLYAYALSAPSQHSPCGEGRRASRPSVSCS